MDARELPLVESPIAGYMMYSYPLAVTFSHIQAWPWFFNSYIQLQCDPSQLTFSKLIKFTEVPKGEVHFTEGTWRFNPWLCDSTQLDKAALSSYGSSISQFVVDKVKEGYYVETFVDEYHISALWNGGKVHFRHRLLIFGYNAAARTFNIVGFDRNRTYRKLDCSYEEFERAFDAVTPQWFETTKLFRPREDALRPVVFDTEKFLHVTRDYLASTNTLLNPDLHGDQTPSDGFWYGMKCYQFFEEYIVKAIDKKISRSDIRGFHIFWEHKKCMLERMKWMQTNEYLTADALIAEYGRVAGLCQLARNRVIMHNRFSTSATSHLTDIPRHLKEAKAIETAVLEQLVAAKLTVPGSA